MNSNKQARIDKNTAELLNLCEKLYREHHPELDKIYISKNKIIFEICDFYLKNTRYEIKREEYKNG